MATVLRPGERLVHRATCGERAPDGSFIRSVKLYEIVSEEEICPRTGLTEGERQACEGIVREMAEQFGKAAEQMEAEARRLRRKNTKRGGKA